MVSETNPLKTASKPSGLIFAQAYTFQTLNNQGKVSERMWKKLRDTSDEVCKRHHLNVIQHPEMGKGKSRWEWDMSRQELSWKAKLKYAIDQVVKESENFEDFLSKCADFGVLVEYNPDHKIDLKFMLAEQKEHNPRAKFTRSRTLGWFYETEQIKSRIAQYQGCMVYVPRTKIKVVTPKVEENRFVNRFVRNAIDRGNMKVASIAKNIPTVENLEKSITALRAKLSAMNTKFNQVDKKARELADAQRTIEEYLRQEQRRDQQKRKKRNDLE